MSNEFTQNDYASGLAAHYKRLAYSLSSDQVRPVQSPFTGTGLEAQAPDNRIFIPAPGLGEMLSWMAGF